MKLTTVVFFQMPYQCIQCTSTFGKLWEVKRHYVRHIHPRRRALMCHFDECNWYGSYDKEYQIHRKSNKHKQMQGLRAVEDEHNPRINPDAMLITDEVATEVFEVEDDGDYLDQTAMEKENQVEVPKRKKHQKAKPLREKNTIEQPRAANPELEETEDETESAVRSILSMPTLLSPIPQTPVRDEHTPPPVKRLKLTSPAVAASSSLSTAGPSFAPGRTVEPQKRDVRAIQIMQKFMEESSEETTSEDNMRLEFQHLRKDNSHHAVQLRSALKELTEEVKEGNRRVEEAVRKNTNRRSDFQDRLELAGHGAKLLDILGARHPHGEGFAPSCELCQKGNDTLMALIAQTDRRLVDPFRPALF